jgi:hypothetical protein
MGPLVVSYGGGVNSIAMLIGMKERGERPDAIVFSDTRGEKPETYYYLDVILPKWLSENGFPPLIKVCRADFPNSKTGDISLEAECLRLGTLPSRAYGFGTCADKWKIDPFKWWSKTWQPAKDAWAAGGVVTRCIGYDAGEERRIGNTSDKGFDKRYPLLEWKWDREACLAAIDREGLPPLPKSACFYCPSSTKKEIIQLGKTDPDLLNRAIAIESNALASGRWSIEGLGRRFSWKSLVATEDKSSFPEAAVESCTICADGLDD